jgi:hypothetical protein
MEFCRTPTNRLGVLAKDAQLNYYQIDLEEGESILNHVRNERRYGS